MKKYVGTDHMRNYRLERAQIFHQPLERTFAFFSDAFNLEKITPPLLRFRILTPSPIEMGEGAVLDYQLTLFGMPFRWRTLIESWVPGKSFVDRQVKGPYALWRHIHTFEALGPAQTLVRDQVEYRIPFGPLGRLAHQLFVAESLKRIFDYRAEMTAHLLSPDSQSLIEPPKVADQHRMPFSGLRSVP
jgi:ligand-binding SRPBCC domain-containing protein